MKEEFEKIETGSKKSTGRWWKVLVIFFMFFFILLLSAQQFINRNIGADWVAKKLSETLKTEVAIDSIHLGLFGDLDTYGFLIRDHHQDTLLYAGHLQTGLRSLYNPGSDKKLNLGDVYLKDGFINLNVYKGEPYHNMRMTFNPETKEPGEPKPPFTMGIASVEADNFKFYNSNENRGVNQKYYLRKAEIAVKDLLLDANHIMLDDAHLSGLRMMAYIEDVDTPTHNEEKLFFDSSHLSAPKLDSNFVNRNLPFQLTAGHIQVTDSYAEIHNNARSPNWDGNTSKINYDHLIIQDINLDVRNYFMEEKSFLGEELFISLKTPSGFEVSDAKISKAIVDSTQVSLLGLNLLTPYSHIKDTVQFKYMCYDSWRDFNNRVFIDAQVDNSIVALKDIMYLAPKLYDNTFFINSEGEALEVNGRIVGRVNSLKARDLRLNLGDQMTFSGDVSTRDLTLHNQQFFGLGIDQLSLDIESLEKIIPDFTLPNNFKKLGDIQYNGRFDGYFQDFVTFGKLNSRLGSADLDMRLDLKPGRRNATYSGRINLVDFDLATWANHQDFDKLSMEVSVSKGKGLVLENAEVSLAGNIHHFGYKKYDYENVEINGQLSKSSFDGYLSSQTDDADFVFNGSISGLDSVPEYQFFADVNEIRLQNLNLSNKKIDFGGNMEVSLRGLNWKELIGVGSVNGFWINYNQEDSLYLDSVRISQVNAQGGRKLNIQSKSGNVEVDGVYDLPNIHKDLLFILQENHPKLSELINLNDIERRDTFIYDYRFNVQMDDPLDIVEYFTYKKIDINKINLQGNISTANQSVQLIGNSPYLRFNNIGIDNSDFSLFNNKELIIYKWESDDVTLSGNTLLEELISEGNFDKDQGKMSLTFEDPKSRFKDVNLNAEFEPVDNQLKISFDPAYFTYSGSTWRFFPGNNLTVGKKSLDFEDFTLSSFEQVLQIEEINDGQGINATIDQFSADLLDSLIALRGFDFAGRFSASLEVRDIYKGKGFDLKVYQDDFLVNDRSEGKLDVHIFGESLSEGLNLDVNITDGEKGLYAEGLISDQKYAVDIDVDKYPLDILEYIIANGISSTSGTATGKLKLEGKKKDFDILGSLIATGSTTIDYIGVPYFFENQQVDFDPGFLDFNGVILKDSDGNFGTVDGGLGHRSFRDWSLNVGVSTGRLQMLNTTAEQNPNYYGTAYGSGEVNFYGTFEEPSIDITATTGRGTSLVIPVSGGGGETTTDFVKFVRHDSTKVDTVSENLEGMNLEMRLNITEDAIAKIIFDEQAGDILQGRGRGNMLIKLARSGDISVYGDYEIEEGDYLFTLLNFVNKPFVVQQGGNIRWTGDPINALINLTAEYANLEAAPYPLLQDFAAGNESLSAARRPTKIDLKMILTGSLLQPLIAFDIDVPELVGEVKTYTENKLQIMRSDPNELNRQVFGLVVFGSFLPPQDQANALATNIGASTVNTFSEYLSNQLSIFVSRLLNNLVDGVDFISGVDVDLNYIQRYDIQSKSNTITDGEYQFRLKNRLWNDRWVVTIGGNYGSQSISAEGNPYFNPETVVEWNTPVRGLKLRVYYRGEDSLQGQRQRVGGGVRYRKEFDSFSEFINAIKTKDQSKSK